MFLVDQQIFSRIESKQLVIDPIPEKHAIGFCDIELRLGTFFNFQSRNLKTKNSSYDPIKISEESDDFFMNNTLNIELGESITVNPKTNLIATTLEFIKIPSDLIGFIYPRSAWSRLGLQIIPSTIDPSFEGRLALSIFNSADYPIQLYPGLRILRILFASLKEIPSPYVIRKSKYAFADMNLTSGLRDKEIFEIRERLKEQAKEVQPNLQDNKLKDLFNKSLNASKIEKGKIFEQFSNLIFENINGIKIIKSNARLKSEEVDILLQNDIGFGFWHFAGSPIVVECKNWSSRVGSKEISIIADKMASISPDVKTAILISPNGVTGSDFKDAVSKIREKRQQGKNIIVLNSELLQKLVNGEPITKILEEAYNNLIVI